MRLLSIAFLIRCSLILLLPVAACNVPQRSITPDKLPADPVNGPYYHKNNFGIISPDGSAASDSIVVQYLGCGGLYVRKNQLSFLVDPFFSNVKMLPGLKIRLRRLMWLAVLVRRDVKVKPHVKSVNAGFDLVMRQPGYVPPRALLITHGHYDHLLDVPYIYKTRLTTSPAPPIYGNLTAVNLLKDMVDPGQLHDLEPGMQNQHNTGTWNTIGDPGAAEYIRFMAIEADHAPHAKSLKLFDGDGLHPLGNYDQYLDGTPINRWLEGRTLGFLVDFMKGKEIAYRMFIQTSASAPTRGLLSAALKKEKKVDLAVICVASFELVDEYPDALLLHLNPELVMLAHWEDFLFKSYAKIRKKPKTIGYSDVREFMRQLQETRTRYGLNYRYFMPAPGAIGTVKFNSKNAGLTKPGNN